jgi:hypothetical protein
MYKLCKRLALAALSSILLSACTNSDSTPVPRKYAYPRSQIAEATYSPADSVADVDFDINTAAATLVVRHNGCDILYPKYSATVYVSVISDLNTPEKFDAAWQNRAERIDRDLSSAQKNTTKVKNKTFDGVVIISPTVTQTPVHLLCADINRGVIVSATAFMHNDLPTNAYDSIAPIYRAIAEDITNLGQTLRCK